MLKKLRDTSLTVMLLLSLNRKVQNMSIEMDKMAEELAENTTVVESATVLLDTLAEEIRTNAGDKEAMLELANRLDSNNAALSEAVARNTKAQDEEPTPEPEPTA